MHAGAGAQAPQPKHARQRSGPVTKQLVAKRQGQQRLGTCREAECVGASLT